MNIILFKKSKITCRERCFVLVDDAKVNGFICCKTVIYDNHGKS